MTTFLLLLGVLVVRIADPSILQLIRARVFDLYQQTQPRAAPEENPVVIIDIDERSIAEVGQFQWPRTVIAQLIEKATKAGATAIGFDVVFAEADRTSIPTITDAIPDAAIDSGARARLKDLPTNDAILAQAIAASGRVVLGQTEAIDAHAYNAAPPLTSFATVGDDPRQFLEHNPDLLRPLPELDKVAAGRGLVSFSQKFFDGIVRQVPMVVTVKNDLYPALSLEMLRVRLGGRTIGIATDKALGGITQIFVRPPRSTQRYVVATDDAGQVWVYYRPHSSWVQSYISATDLLHDRVAPERLAGKLVLVGTSATGLFDLRSTPLDSVLPGVEVHANILENIIFRNQLTRPTSATLVELAATAALGMLMIVITPMVSARIGAFTFLAIAGGSVWYSWNAFVSRHELYDPTFPLLVALLFYSFLTYAGYTREESQRKQVRSAFGHYLSPALVERLAKNPEQLTLGGENREMTFMFSDVRGFTSMSEIFDAQGLTRLINRLLTPLTQVILAENGTIDKYMGDCIMAFWNAPLTVADHAAAALRAALRMVTALAQVNAALEQEALAEGREHRPLAVGIGLNSGIACVGNMGSDQRFDYSVLGDNVNLASRLEGQSKTYGVTIVLGEQTAALARGFAILELDLIRVKGKKQAVRIFTLVGDTALAAEGWFTELAHRHDAMLAAYRAQRWDDAQALIASCNSCIEGRTGLVSELPALYEVYAKRIAAFRREAPGEHWDGVYVAETK